MSKIPRTDVLGVDIDPLTFEAAVQRILAWTEDVDAPGRYIVTPNINHIVLHHKHEDFRDAYAHASLVLADGRYVILLSGILGQRLPEPINGSDLVPAVFSASDKYDELRVFLLGALEGVAEQAAARIEEKWPSVKVVGTYSPPIGFEKSEVESQKMRTMVNKLSPDILIVGLSPPKQEIWLSQNIHDLNIKVGICAGATIDFLAGIVPRAPIWMQKVGLEWLFRVIMEPRRLAPRYAKDGFIVIKLLFSRIRSGRRIQKH